MLSIISIIANENYGSLGWHSSPTCKKSVCSNIIDLLVLTIKHEVFSRCKISTFNIYEIQWLPL